ncbi:MAG TPA: hypothetical protein VFI29_19785 [Hanamia sp.]|nr:hypothetical protein [Hanamia sp.]
MKKIIFLCLAALFSTGVFASPLPDPGTSAKILKIFHHDFPEVSSPKIYTVGDYYMIYFKNEENNSSCRIYYDADGKVLQTIKYYSCAELAPFIRAKINSGFKGKDISSVSEVTNGAEHYYQIILKDSKTMFVVDYDVNGSLQKVKRYNRG